MQRLLGKVWHVTGPCCEPHVCLVRWEVAAAAESRFVQLQSEARVTGRTRPGLGPSETEHGALHADSLPLRTLRTTSCVSAWAGVGWPPLQLMKHVNADGRLNVFYSTPSTYVAARHAANLTWPTKTDDFFPYADRPHAYWTVSPGTLRQLSQVQTRACLHREAHLFA